MGIFNCPHRDCPYKTPNRSVFVIHLAYVHQELKLKIAESGQDPTIILPDVFVRESTGGAPSARGSPTSPPTSTHPSANEPHHGSHGGGCQCRPPRSGSFCCTATTASGATSAATACSRNPLQ
ncbi:Uncharacterized protein FKW44_002006 [Caligus rogercresseyi]|uniref:Uncharacterized protein n=1 Tax=Caligus rogercresseyi TaxID=217165 RepID=A0A7T8QW12_CALRO|nr:Uncharacterized protein FKW44_002006 [Caligus rogercresseyi]